MEYKLKLKMLKMYLNPQFGKSWTLPVDIDCSEKLLDDFVVVQSSYEAFRGLTLSSTLIFVHLHSFLENHIFDIFLVKNQTSLLT